MSSSKPSSSSKKRKYPFSETGESVANVDSDLAPKDSKKAKPKKSSDSPGYFVMSSTPNTASKMDLDGTEGEGSSKLLPEERKEIEAILDDVEMRKRRKREKRALRRTNPPAPQPVELAVESSIEYLRSWHSDRSNWKFKSARESWLIRNWRDVKLVRSSIQFQALEFVLRTI